MAELITELPLEQLHPSPFNPRRTFTGIDELAASIASEGRVHQPLLVRPRTTNPLRDDVHDGYEIVFGHRRARAAEAAGLQHVPCMVRAMTDAEARQAQVAENLQRVDVHPIEEAEGFQAMLEADGWTADTLAELVGKSRSHVYGRLKLLQACAQVRQACLDGEIGSEVALLLARLRTDKLQADALRHLRAHNVHLEDGGARSFRHMRDLLAERYTLALKGALFDPADAALVAEAGACAACPKRSGNAPEYADVVEYRPRGAYDRTAGGSDVCTDPDCFAAKKAAHLARQAEALRAKGGDVVAGAKARAAVSAGGEVKGAYVSAKTVKDDSKRWTPAQRKAFAAVTPVTIQDPRSGQTTKAYRRDDLVGAGFQRYAPPAPAAKGRPPGQAEQAKRDAAVREREAVAARREAARRNALLAAVRQAAAVRPRSELELRLVARRAVAGVEWRSRQALLDLYQASSEEALLRQVEHMRPDALALLLLDCVIVDDVFVRPGYHPAPANLLALAAQYGVDPKQVQAEATGGARDEATADMLGRGSDDQAASDDDLALEAAGA